MVTIRRFTREDAPSVKQCLYPDMTEDEVIDMIDEWNSCVFRGRRFEMFAIVLDERPVGCVSLYEQSRSVVSVGAEVAEAEQGKGAASQALALLMEYASQQGYRIVLDQVRTDNAASIRLHEKLGFESDGYIYRNRRGSEVFLYLKPL